MDGKLPEAASFANENAAAEPESLDLSPAETKELLELLLAFSRLDAVDRVSILEFARTMAGASDVS